MIICINIINILYFSFIVKICTNNLNFIEEKTTYNNFGHSNCLFVKSLLGEAINDVEKNNKIMNINNFLIFLFIKMFYLAFFK